MALVLPAINGSAQPVVPRQMRRSIGLALQAIRHLPNETQLTIGVAVVSISREYRQDETVVFDR